MAMKRSQKGSRKNLSSKERSERMKRMWAEKKARENGTLSPTARKAVAEDDGPHPFSSQEDIPQFNPIVRKYYIGIHGQPFDMETLYTRDELIQRVIQLYSENPTMPEIRVLEVDTIRFRVIHNLVMEDNHSNSQERRVVSSTTNQIVKNEPHTPEVSPVENEDVSFDPADIMA